MYSCCYQTIHQELMGNSNSRIGIAYLKKLNWNLELKFATKRLNSEINLPLNFLIQKYFFHDNPTWNINWLE